MILPLLPRRQTGRRPRQSTSSRLLSSLHSALLLLAAIASAVCGSNRAAWAQNTDSNRSESRPGAAEFEFFESRIRPVLVEHCYECHNSSGSREGDLAVDFRGGLINEGDLEAGVVVPGRPAKSRLLAVIKHEIAGLEMPEGGAKLEDATVRDFEKWIASGAADPRDEPPAAEQIAADTSWEAILQRRKKWWSFQPIADVAPPTAVGEATPNHPIDRFIVRRLQEEGLLAARSAADHVLVRRLFIALIGLPPSPKQFRQWNDRLASAVEPSDRQNVIEELVDQLLSSVHFGERWARHWMDWIRYAESHGSEGDPRIDNAWMYRDYLIRALNDDVPYDQLVREHVAGDLLTNPRIDVERDINESAIGTAHWRMVFHGFAPTDALDEKVRFVDDQINAFSKAVLGLTVSCARCHDHKFDAISQADYYALFGILSACRPARVVIDTKEQRTMNRQQLAALKSEIRDVIAGRWIELLPEISQKLRQRRWSDRAAKSALLRPLAELSTDSSESQLHDQWRKHFSRSLPSVEVAEEAKRWKLDERNELKHWYTSGTGLARQPKDAGVFAIQISGDQVLKEIYPSGVYSHLISDKHAARLTSPDQKIQPNQELWVLARGEGQATLRYVIQDYPRTGTVFPVKTLTPDWKWHRFDLSYWAGDQMHLELVTARDAPLLVKEQDRSWFAVREVVLQPIGSSRPPEYERTLKAIAATDNQPPATYEALAERYAKAIEQAIVGWKQNDLSSEHAELLQACLEAGLLPNDLRMHPELESRVQRYRQLESEIPVPTRVPGLDETVGRTQPLYVRGNHKQPAETIPKRFLEAVDATPYNTVASGRLQLAEDLLRDDNPFTRRVIVNRLWHHLFGQGIVTTTDNFGRLGSKPSHPELLDWLASELPRRDWSLKEMIRLMVTSSTFQQASPPSDRALEYDPDNRWLSHANVRRMEAEVIRDTLLAAAGELETDVVGGPPVASNSPRRSVYVRVIRNSLDPFLRSFDFPEPFSTTGRRAVTNVPAQSLTMMNSPQVLNYAKGLTARILGDSSLDSDSQRLRQMFIVLFSRTPDDAEIETAQAYLQQTAAWYRDRQRKAEQIVERIEQAEREIAAKTDPIRERLWQARQSRARDIAVPSPVLEWNFEDSVDSDVGDVESVPHGNATREEGKLSVRSGGYVLTSPLSNQLGEKTLEAWVKLDDLGQQGGGVLSVQTVDGKQFDAIVFGEQQQGHWLAGSEFFRRTKAFGGPTETEADQRFVQIVVAYHADGQIAAYRNGKPYGKPYQSKGPIVFQPEQAVITLGLRHLPAGGNRLLSGQIDVARIYDRALNEQEIQASFEATAADVDFSQILAAMDRQDRNVVEALTERLKSLRSELDSLRPRSNPDSETLIWNDLTLALLTMKELMYVR